MPQPSSGPGGDDREPAPASDPAPSSEPGRPQRSSAPPAEPATAKRATAEPMSGPPSLERPDQLEADRVRAAIRRRLFDAKAAAPQLGRFELGERIGAGAMGAVFVALDQELKRDVALKVIRPRSSGEQAEAVRRRLLREARAMARLRHPNVITVFEAGVVDDQAFIAMEYVKGQTLRGWLAEQHRSWQQIVEVFLQAGRGLVAAHDADLVHRDFKPDNVLIGSDGRVQVTDFGVAQAFAADADPDATPDSTPASNADTDPLGQTVATEWGRAGTPRYMAPEQHSGGDIDARTDQFAFCVALYEALLGAPPFAGSTIAELAEAVQAGTVQEPATKRRIPARILRALRRGLQPDPARRYPSMAALLSELSAALGSRRSWYLAAGVIGVLGLSGYALASQQPAAPVDATVAAATGTAAQSATASAAGTTSDTTAPAPSAAADAAPPLPALAATTIDAGQIPGTNTWLPEFRIVRDEGDQQASYLEAQQACQARTMALCTESQWMLACAKTEALAAFETWTASAVTDRGFVARGGRGSCSTRRVVPGAERSALRAGACCSRAVGIASDNVHHAFRAVTTQKLLTLEAAFSKGNTNVLATLIADPVLYLAHSRPRAEFLKLVSGTYHQNPDHWLLHDVCDVSLYATGGENAWVADCRSIAQAGGRIAHLVRRYVFGGPEGQVQSIAEPAVLRAMSPL